MKKHNKAAEAAPEPVDHFAYVLATAQPDDIVAVLVDPECTEFFPGVPLRDLTAAEVGALKLYVRNGLIDSKLYALK